MLLAIGLLFTLLKNNGMAYGMEFGGEFGKLFLSIFRTVCHCWYRLVLVVDD
jgi:signal peptidase II